MSMVRDNSSVGVMIRDTRQCPLLGHIEVWRLEYGRPTDEPRHPAIESGFPWPI